MRLKRRRVCRMCRPECDTVQFGRVLEGRMCRPECDTVQFGRVLEVRRFCALQKHVFLFSETFRPALRLIHSPT